MKFFSDVLCVYQPCVINAGLANTPKSENAVSIQIVKLTIVHKVHSLIGQRKEQHAHSILKLGVHVPLASAIGGTSQFLGAHT